MVKSSVLPKVEETVDVLISHKGEPVKPSTITSRDSFRYRGSLEDNVMPVITICFDTMIDDDLMTGTLHRDLTPGG